MVNFCHELKPVLEPTKAGAYNPVLQTLKRLIPMILTFLLFLQWGKWLMKWQVEGDKHQGEAELLAETINLSAGFSEELLSDTDEYGRLTHITNTICQHLAHYQMLKVSVRDNKPST